MDTTVEVPAALIFPELVIGIAGPIGVDLVAIVETLQAALIQVNYDSSVIKLTDEMARFQNEKTKTYDKSPPYVGTDTFNIYMRKMSEANALRKQYDDPSILAAMAIEAIQQKRSVRTGNPLNPCPSRAYIVRQLKRPEEVLKLREVYGRQFILVSAYAPEHARRDQLSKRLKIELPESTPVAEITHQADQLISRDASEDDERMGQQLRETFHHADVFIDGLDVGEMKKTIERFINALFGKNEIAHSKDEYGMYTAKSASLRSSDLSRQVGAAIFSEDGEIVTQGCNEVPKAFGGTYWDLEKPDHRDIKKGFDPNEFNKRRILRDLVERFRKRNYFAATVLADRSDEQIVDDLIRKDEDQESQGALVGSQIMDLTEYGRVVHAEMLAICDAARLGRSVKGATLFCTTFPCHNCTKHLLASGIRRVVFMEPYPKSRAKDLHPDEIEIEAESDDKVSFVPFMGISPFRYRDLFAKGRRKEDSGNANEWYKTPKRPMIEGVNPNYPQTERWALRGLLGAIVERS